MTIECPAPQCGRRFRDRDRASLLAALGADGAAVELNKRQESTTRCPDCGEVIQFGLLMLDDDGVWRTSRFAGHADDVTVMRPPGGGVAYAQTPADRQVGLRPEDPAGLRPSVRERALAVLEGRVRRVAPGIQRDVLELALDAGALDHAEAAQARALLERGLRP
jgi:hypothetical protein